eukprot:2663146-Pyramimonas_sp.AAC.1
MTCSWNQDVFYDPALPPQKRGAGGFWRFSASGVEKRERRTGGWKVTPVNDSGRKTGPGEVVRTSGVHAPKRLEQPDVWVPLM